MRTGQHGHEALVAGRFRGVNWTVSARFEPRPRWSGGTVRCPERRRRENWGRGAGRGAGRFWLELELADLLEGADLGGLQF